MMKLLKFLGGLIVVLAVVAVSAYLWAVHAATVRYEKRWSAHDVGFPIPFPLDSAEIETVRQERLAAGDAARDPLEGVDFQALASQRAEAHGRHLIETRLGCNACHGEDFGGGVIINAPLFGYWAAPNLTSGPGGITSGFSAHDWDLAVRHGIRHTGASSSMPCNEFTSLSDHELSDVAAYIRSRPPVDRRMGAVRLGPVFAFMVAMSPKALPAFAIDHQKPHAVEPPPAAVTVEFGRHIAQACGGCHNSRFSGGKMDGDPNMPIVANITPDATGLRTWTEADFLRAMREGRRPDGTPIREAMPWKSFRGMSDTELKAVWMFLQSLPPVPKGQK